MLYVSAGHRANREDPHPLQLHPHKYIHNPMIIFIDGGCVVCPRFWDWKVALHQAGKVTHCYCVPPPPPCSLSTATVWICMNTILIFLCNVINPQCIRTLVTLDLDYQC
jgi:hypothetical protein